MTAENQPRPVLYRIREDDPANPNPSNYRPAVVVWEISSGYANLLVFLDGSNDRGLLEQPELGLCRSKADAVAGDCSYVVWATSRSKGDELGQWREAL